mmetsp:Transcript_20790/g.47804  ORF Transcript_20790/g.47804 Transcript_20790/m.47804 type:complete len:213 (-) Transcript_20790:1659-2297(-)
MGHAKKEDPEGWLMIITITATQPARRWRMPTLFVQQQKLWSETNMCTSLQPYHRLRPRLDSGTHSDFETSYCTMLAHLHTSLSGIREGGTANRVCWSWRQSYCSLRPIERPAGWEAAFDARRLRLHKVATWRGLHEHNLPISGFHETRWDPWLERWLPLLNCLLLDTRVRHRTGFGQCLPRAIRCNHWCGNGNRTFPAATWQPHIYKSLSTP